jgi:hypothetical protein
MLANIHRQQLSLTTVDGYGRAVAKQGSQMRQGVEIVSGATRANNPSKSRRLRASRVRDFEGSEEVADPFFNSTSRYKSVKKNGTGASNGH